MSHSRTSLFVLLFSVAVISPALAADAAVTGTVVDSLLGRPIPHAHVRLLDQSGREIASTFADENGRFDAWRCDDCRVEASLPGFEPRTVACSTSPLRVELGVAPVAENVVVTATSTATPTSQVGASVSVFTAGASGGAPRAVRGGAAPHHARRHGDPDGRTGWRYLPFRSRRREQLQQSAHRRHSDQPAGRHVQFRQPHHR